MNILFIEKTYNEYFFCVRIELGLAHTIIYNTTSKTIHFDTWFYMERHTIFTDSVRIKEKDVPENIMTAIQEKLDDPFFELDLERYIANS